jgi:hypothetical protein
MKVKIDLYFVAKREVCVPSSIGGYFIDEVSVLEDSGFTFDDQVSAFKHLADNLLFDKEVVFVTRLIK